MHTHTQRILASAGALITALSSHADFGLPADFWQGNANYSYRDSGTFFLDGDGAKVQWNTRTGLIELFQSVGSPSPGGDFGDWLVFLDAEFGLNHPPPPVPPPFDSHETPFWTDSLISVGYVQGDPGKGLDHLTVFAFETFTAGDKTLEYITEFRANTDYAYNGANSWTASGQWSYLSTRLTPLSNVPDSGATAPLLGLSLIGLMWLRSTWNKPSES